MIQIKLLKDWRKKKAGDIINISKEGAEQFVKEGAGEYLKQPKLTSEQKEIVEEVFKKVKTGRLSKSVFSRVSSVIEKYIDTTPENVEILSLWVIGTYFHKDFETFPLLQLYAQKRSGKTRTLKLLSNLAYGSDGSVSTSPTETLLFRHKEGALFFDEMENISSKERSAFRETLNAVYKKGNKIIRYKEKKVEGVKEYVEDIFYPYYPLALANINGLNDVLEDRAVQVILRRSNKEVTKLVEDFKTNEDIIKLKEELSNVSAVIPEGFFTDWNRFVKHLESEIKDKELIPLFEKISKTKIYGRSLEIFFPLFIVGFLCGVIDQFLTIAQEYVVRKEQEESVEDIDERLKSYISSKFKGGFDYTPLSSILVGFREYVEATSEEKWINPKWLSNSLTRLGLVKQKRIVNGKSQVILNVIPTNSTTLTTSTTPTIPTNTEIKVGEVGEVGEKGLVVLVEEFPKEWSDSDKERMRKAGGSL